MGAFYCCKGLAREDFIAGRIIDFWLIGPSIFNYYLRFEFVVLKITSEFVLDVVPNKCCPIALGTLFFVDEGPLKADVLHFKSCF